MGGFLHCRKSRGEGKQCPGSPLLRTEACWVPRGPLHPHGLTPKLATLGWAPSRVRGCPRAAWSSPCFPLPAPGTCSQPGKGACSLAFNPLLCLPAAKRPVSPYSGYNGQLLTGVYQPTEMALMHKGPVSGPEPPGPARSRLAQPLWAGGGPRGQCGAGCRRPHLRRQPGGTQSPSSPCPLPGVEVLTVFSYTVGVPARPVLLGCRTVTGTERCGDRWLSSPSRWQLPASPQKPGEGQRRVSASWAGWRSRGRGVLQRDRGGSSRSGWVLTLPSPHAQAATLTPPPGSGSQMLH